MAKRKKQEPAGKLDPIGQKKGDDGLTVRQRQFVVEYQIDLCATQAAIRAGFSKKTAGQQGYQLLQIPSISLAIRKALREVLDSTQMTADDVLLEAAAIARSNVLDYVKFGPEGVGVRDSDELTEGQAKALAMVAETYSASGMRQFKFKTHDKMKALELLSKYHKLYDDSMVNINLTLADVMTQITERQAARAARTAKEAEGEAKKGE